MYGTQITEGKGTRHTQMKTPRICKDYFQMNKRDPDDGNSPLMIATDEDTGDKYARAVGRKGVGEHGNVDWLP